MPPDRTVTGSQRLRGQASAKGWGFVGRIEGGRRQRVDWAGKDTGPVKSGYLCGRIIRAQNRISRPTSLGSIGPMVIDPWP